ncbi:LLM class flavin-dependent oxidoreductase [Nocardia sp. NPDC005745]|uniref:LLM class flavin-dependent oxidoreductase n=1 Tax=Nocardia sp. NPDC005745 TaxID=3157061 RepID=UPI0033C3C61E
MKVFVTLGPDQRQAASDAAAAEAAGFDGVSTGEHLFFHGATPNAFVSLAAAAGATSRIRLLSSLTILPLYSAALAAKLAIGLDQVSEGRFDFGIGVGGEFPGEFTAAGVPARERGPRTNEALDVLTRLFTGETTEFHGTYTHVPGLRIMPPPIQAGGPPLWVGGRRPAALRRAGRFADVWFPYMYTPEQLADSLTVVRQHAERHGRDPTTITGAIHCWGGVDDDPARPLARGGRRCRRRNLSAGLQPPRRPVSPARDAGACTRPNSGVPRRRGGCAGLLSCRVGGAAHSHRRVLRAGGTRRDPEPTLIVYKYSAHHNCLVV